MTEIKPATDAEIELVRDNVRRGIGIADKFAPGVLACLDAERARAERELQEKRWIIAERDRTFALMLARAEAAEAKLATAREALRQAYDDAPGWVDLARAALDDTGGVET
jgi:hypothetical protein